MDGTSQSLGWLKQPALLVSLAAIVTFYAGWSLLDARVSLAQLPDGEIRLDFHHYVMLGLYPTVLFLMPLLLAWLSVILGNKTPGPRLVTFIVVYPALVIAVTHVIDGTLDEATMWMIGAVALGLIWWRRAGQQDLAMVGDWAIRTGYVFTVVLAVGHVGTAVGHLDDPDGTSIKLEMHDSRHPLHNRTMSLAFHHAGNYYLREPGASQGEPTFIVNEAAVKSVAITE